MIVRRARLAPLVAIAAVMALAAGCGDLLVVAATLQHCLADRELHRLDVRRGGLDLDHGLANLLGDRLEAAPQIGDRVEVVLAVRLHAQHQQSMQTLRNNRMM